MTLESLTQDIEAMLDGRDVDLTLAEEKRQLQHLNVGLAEKVAVMREAEATVVAKMQDFR